MLVMKYETKTVFPASFESLSDSEKVRLNAMIAVFIRQAHDQGKPFTIRDLVGRSVFQTWDNTPLDPIYQYHKNKGTPNPVRQAGIDVGNLFKNAMSNSTLTFVLDKQFVNHYIPV